MERSTEPKPGTARPPRDGARAGKALAEVAASAGNLAWTVTVQEVIGIVQRRWVIPILRELASGPKRRFQLRLAIKGIAPKVLTHTLRSLEHDGVIECVLHHEGNGNKSIVFQLTELGDTLAEPIASLYAWGRAHLDDVHRSQREIDALWDADGVLQGARGAEEVPESPL